MNKNNKKYGLIVSKKELSAPKVGNVFGNDDSDEEETGGANWVEKTIKAESEKHQFKKQTKLNVQKALEVDPTIFQYDEIYDDMEKAREEKVVSTKKEAKKPKYVHNIVRAAERRKLENERRIERMVQKERDAEGDMYKDKEVFVTATHRANLEKMRKMDEEEERIDKLEAIADVTKQPDISGFYRHLYSQTVDKKPIKEESRDESAEPGASTTESIVNIDRDEDLSVDSDSDHPHSKSGSSSDEDGLRKTEKKSFASRKRQYRSRNIKDSDESEEDEDEINDKVKKSEEKEVEVEDKIVEPAVKIEKDSIQEEEKKRCNLKMAKVNEFKVEAEEEKIIMIPKEEKPKMSIWEKRTVGDVFDTAVQRYYARKALRMSS